MKSVQEASGRRHNPDVLIDMSVDSAAGFYEAKPDLRKKIQHLALRLLNPIIDVLLDCFTTLLVEPDESPGVEVSTFAELAEFLIREDRHIVSATQPTAPHRPAEFCPIQLGVYHVSAVVATDSRPGAQLQT